MNSLYICIFGGTTEGRVLSEKLSNLKIKTDLFIATEYGEQFVKNTATLTIHQKRLNEIEMQELFQEKGYNLIVDATHPFAKIVSENISKAAILCNIKYLRIIREKTNNEYCKYFEKIEECINYLNTKEGNILLTTGSKDLDKYTNISQYEDRVYVRILPMIDSLKKCLDLSYSNKNIICMQGPFSEELNEAMLKSMKVRYLVTKESSHSGGFDEKVSACAKVKAECLVIKRQEEIGFTIEKAYKYILRAGIFI